LGCISFIFLHAYFDSVVDRNVVMWRIPVSGSGVVLPIVCVSLFVIRCSNNLLHQQWIVRRGQAKKSGTRLCGTEYVILFFFSECQAPHLQPSLNLIAQFQTLYAMGVQFFCCVSGKGPQPLLCTGLLAARGTSQQVVYPNCLNYCDL